MQFRVDSPAPALAVIRRIKLSPTDPVFGGELRKLYENPGIRANYFGRNGVTLDEMGEALWDAGVLVARPSVGELLEWLETVTTAHLVSVRPGVSNRADWNGAEKALRKAQSNRHRSYRCPSCLQKVRGNRDSSVLCGECRDDSGFPVRMERVDLLPEEVTPMSAAIAEMESPF